MLWTVWPHQNSITRSRWKTHRLVQCCRGHIQSEKINYIQMQFLSFSSQTFLRSCIIFTIPNTACVLNLPVQQVILWIKKTLLPFLFLSNFSVQFSLTNKSILSVIYRQNMKSKTRLVDATTIKFFTTYDNNGVGFCREIGKILN